MHSHSTIAAFDFDCTLTDRDSLVPFLAQMRGWAVATLQLASLAPQFCKYVTGLQSRQQIKEQILKRFVAGNSERDLEALGVRYAANQLSRYLKSEAMQKVAWHQSQGHRCILVSAALEIYLKPWGEAHGFEAVLASRLEYDSQGLATGRLLGKNCWGAEKVSRLIECAGSKHHYQLYAYGDSRGDKELLDFADEPFYREFTRP